MVVQPQTEAQAVFDAVSVQLPVMVAPLRLSLLCPSQPMNLPSLLSLCLAVELLFSVGGAHLGSQHIRASAVVVQLLSEIRAASGELPE